MFRLAAAAVAVAAIGCSTTDDRPLTIEYLTENILAPTCGAAQCHSTFANNLGKRFDTVDGARYSLLASQTCGGANNYLVRLAQSPTDADDRDAPASSLFVTWLTTTDPQHCGIGRMPWDAPMANEDIAYIERWIQNGAIGAQCDPYVNNGFACDHDYLVPCLDWSFAPRNGPESMHCPNGCSAGACQ